MSDPWWKTAVFYEVYVRSFEDSNGDGIGDLNGITSRLDYLVDLGIDAIWITPFYPSPQIDFGYDVSDYEAVDPQFGTLADFDRLVDAAHTRGVKVVLDVVLNHTSDRHPWFEASRSSRESPFRNWYVWRDGRTGSGDDRSPNNWESAFGGPAWTFDGHTGQWYYHHFYPAQPDLNWRNPAVEERMFSVLQFWMNRGVDGFRLDAVSALYEDPALKDNPPLAAPRVTLTGVKTQEFKWSRRLPETHLLLQRLRRFIDLRSSDVVLISEAYVEHVDDLVHFYGDDNEMHLPFNFFLAQAPALDAGALKHAIDLVEHAFGSRWPTLVFSNHDIDRACDRLAPGGDVERVAKLLATLLLTLRGSPFLYYGEEIAMRTEPPERIEDVRDAVGRRFWPRYKGRDGVRRPMAWARVDRQGAERSSVLNVYRGLTRLRRGWTALRVGDYRAVQSHRDVIAFVRETDHDCSLVVVNCATENRSAEIVVDQLPPSLWPVVMFGTDRGDGEQIDLRSLRLAPFEALIAGRPVL